MEKAEAANTCVRSRTRANRLDGEQQPCTRVPLKEALTWFGGHSRRDGVDGRLLHALLSVFIIRPNKR